MTSSLRISTTPLDEKHKYCILLLDWIKGMEVSTPNNLLSFTLAYAMDDGLLFFSTTINAKLS